MVLEGVLGGFDIARFGSQAGGAILIILAGVVFLGMIGAATWLWLRSKRYNEYTAIIYKRFRNKNGDEFVVIDDIDKGAIIKDKKLDKWVLHLKKTNLDLGEEESSSFDEDRELDIPSIPGPKGSKVTFIEKVGNRKYAMGKVWTEKGDVKVIVSEADLAEAKRSYITFTKAFSKKANPLIAFAIYISLAALALVLIIVIVQKFDIINESALHMKEAAEIFRSNGAATASSAPG